MDSFSVLTQIEADPHAKPAAQYPQALTPDLTELKDVISFLNRELRPQAGWSIDLEYPSCFRSTGSLPPTHYMRVIKAKIDPLQQEEQIVSHALVRPLLVKTPVGVFKVAAIGSVVTAQNARGRGYSKATIESCLELAREMGAEIAILWSDLFDFYAKLGFAPAGTETIFSVDRELPRLEGLKMIRTPQVSPDALLRLFQQHSVHSFRTADDVRKHLMIPNSAVYTAWDDQNRMVAYGIEGKGADLSGCLHEWGGSTPALLSLFDFIRNDMGRDLLVMTPALAQNVNRRLEAAGCKRYQGPLGLMRVLNASSVVSKLNRALDLRSVGLKRLTATGTESVETESLTGEIKVTLNGGQTAQTFFGLSNSTEVKGPDSLALIPLWLWGWDSV